jgi:hypothetical protein
MIINNQKNKLNDLKHLINQLTIFKFFINKIKNNIINSL